mmetsp:Transcript_34355/g.102861  ORF Transcript_34355/g.102861 Transcript_34355/m.102861 type:complete len:93 (+) Transcript_34355:168-446(+)
MLFQLFSFVLLLLSPAADAFVTSSVSSSRFKAGLSGNSNDGNRVGQFAQVVLRQSSRVEVDVAREYVAVVDIAKKVCSCTISSKRKSTETLF